ncbi:MAG: TIGR01459 family HAD-type hydrolase [Chitinophagaceae bacterium]
MAVVSFQSVIKKYKVIFFDAYGVLKNYKGLIPGVEKTFEYLDHEKKEYFVITNDASRSPEQLALSFNDIGLTSIKTDHIISSGMLAKEYLDLKVKKGIVAYLGTENSAHYIESSGLRTLPIRAIDEKNIDDVNAIVLLDDEGFDWYSDLNKAVNILRKRTIPAIVANTDNIYPVAKNDVSIAIGGIATMIESIVGKRFLRFGKPDSQIFIFAYEHVRRFKPVGKSEILMIGDTLHTDIIGANKFGLDTMLVLTGNTSPDDAETRIKATGIIPDYICESAVV